jgi:hypothetical protein
VVFPVKCISSTSPRFFCFLPLAAILESSHAFFFCSHQISHYKHS